MSEIIKKNKIEKVCAELTSLEALQDEFANDLYDNISLEFDTLSDSYLADMWTEIEKQYIGSYWSSHLDIIDDVIKYEITLINIHFQFIDEITWLLALSKIMEKGIYVWYR